MTERHEWHEEHGIETAASPETVWGILRDVPGWPRWNAGVEAIAIDGPFATGTAFTMKPTGQEAVRSRLTYVRDNEGFVDETHVGGLVVTVAHRLERVASGGTRVTFAIDVVGEGCDEAGRAIAADFPDVLASLAALASHSDIRVRAT